MTTSTALLDSLTREQWAAVETTDPLAHVQAGPGAGKTRVIAARVAHLIASGEDPAEIAVLTFTRHACATIRERIESQVGPVAAKVVIETFHGAALLLTDPAPYEPREVAPDEMNEATIRSLYSGALRRKGRDVPHLKRLRQAITEYEASGGEGPNRYLGAVLLVRDRLREVGLLPTWCLIPRLLTRGPARSFRHVLVDESQDCTPAECRMAALLCEAPGGSLYVVGDPRQGIMGWRGAAPSWGRVTHRLARTWRFGHLVAEEANRLGVGEPIAGSSYLQSDVFRELRLEDVGPLCSYAGSTAILTRTHADATALEQILPDRVRHVPRDAHGDPLESPADRIGRYATDGHVPALTVHAAKGLEWDQVIVVGPSTIRWGLASDEPEERRTLFVAMTRARRRLVLVGGLPEIEGWRVRADGLAGGGA